MQTRSMLAYVYLAVTVLLSGCQTLPATPQEALNRLPEYIPTPTGYRPETTRVLETFEAAGGTIIVYAWQADEVGGGQCRLAAAYVTPDGLGWRPQSTLSLAEPLGADCQPDALTTGTLSGSEVSALTAVFGASDRGVAVRLTWPDGQTQVVPLTNGVFVQARPEVFTTWELELLDAFGNVIERESLT